MGCFSGCLMSSASIQKLFCGIYSALKCSFDEFLREKVVSPSYSFAILGLPPKYLLLIILSNGMVSGKEKLLCVGRHLQGLLSHGAPHKITFI